MPSDFLEKTLEAIIYENHKAIPGRGLKLKYTHIDRQFALPSGKKIDLLNWQIVDDVLYATIIELKKDQLSESALWQVLGYLDEFTCHSVGRFPDMQIDIMLIGDEFNQNIAQFLQVSAYVSVYTYKYSYDGILFQEIENSLDLMLKINRKIPKPMFEEETITKRLKFQSKLREEAQHLTV